MSKLVKSVLDKVIKDNPGETEFHQAAEELLESVADYVEKNKKYQDYKILERIVEPERVVSFKVEWLNDKGEIEINKGYRIQFNSAIGPYKGGLRFHPSVNLSILKFLGFEQTFKNSLTGLPIGGGKGGSNFDPKGKSDNEVMKFCQVFMMELQRHIGANTDVPAGDIGVGGREIGYLFGMYKKLRNEFTGVLTGKGRNWGGSLIRPEATGYGLMYFVDEMMKNTGDSMQDMVVSISGSGNVAQYAAEKAIELGGKVVTMSDSSGFVYDKNGIDNEKLSFIMDLKNNKRGRIKEYADKYDGVEFVADARPWGHAKYDVALPCATQNEIEEADAKTLIENGIKYVAEGANMPSTNDSIKLFQKSSVLFGPAKACNAGGVATSGLEMSQNSLRMSWTREEVDQRLKDIMKEIHEKCLEHGKTKKGVNYVDGANIAGFIKVADSMIDQGIV